MALEGKQFGRYHVLHLIGKGGMGEVYLVEDIQVQRQVAAKLISIEMVQSEQEIATNTLRLFWREATAIARLDHPSILPLYDHGETIIDGSHFAYLIMPYRPEGSLLTWLRRRAQAQQTQQPTFKQVAHIIQQAGRALQYAHDHQTMHLDIKPANFLVRSRSIDDDYPDLLLSDFGIARLIHVTSSISQHSLGTPTYMPPEQSEGQPMFASDQYALAIMAYELLTGSPPFQGSPLSVMFAHANKRPPLARDLNPLLPPAIDLVLQRTLAKKPEERYPSVAAFAQDFQAAFQGIDEATTLHILRPSVPSFPQPSTVASLQKPVSSFPITPKVSAFTSQDPVTFSSASTLAQSTHRRSPMVVGSILLVILLLLGAGSLGIYRIIMGIQQGQATAIANARIISTAKARASATAEYIATATGKIWHINSSSSTATLTAVTWSGFQFVSVGSGGSILTSSNGHTWAVQHSSNGQSLSDLVWSGHQFVAVGENGTILTSPDGRSWTLQNSKTSNNLQGIVWSGTQFVAVGYHPGGGGIILTSPDGRSWTLQNTGSQGFFSGIAWSGTQFVVVGDEGYGGPGIILTSPDGRNWISQNIGISDYLQRIVWSGSQFVAVGFHQASPDNAIILTSPDGRTWTSQNIGIVGNLHGIVWSGTQFVAVGYDITFGNAIILTSPDGRTWTPQNIEVSHGLIGIVWSGTQFVVVGGGVILTSP